MQDIFKFVTDTTRENFMEAQDAIFSHPDYNPYSKDIEKMTRWMDEGKYVDVVHHSNINLLLCPQAYLMRHHAAKETGDREREKAELILATKIMEGIGTTGNGSADSPFRITRISDETAFLSYLSEQPVSQQLRHSGGKIFDVWQCASGKSYYFDITIPYNRMQTLFDTGALRMPFDEEKEKKWWQFWK